MDKRNIINLGVAYIGVMLLSFWGICNIYRGEPIFWQWTWFLEHLGGLI